MGMTSAFITRGYSVHWPEWFVEKYSEFVNFDIDKRDNSPCGLISSKQELRPYSGDCGWGNLVTDIQKAIDWNYHYWKAAPFVLVFLHDCGGITRCQIEETAIKWSEPINWRITKGIDHSSCYGCSDADGYIYEYLFGIMVNIDGDDDDYFLCYAEKNNVSLVIDRNKSFKYVDSHRIIKHRVSSIPKDMEEAVRPWAFYSKEAAITSRIFKFFISLL